MNPSLTSLWAERAERMQSEWATVLDRETAADLAEVGHWNVRLRAMRERRATLRAAGAWATGPRTLMGALRLQHNEVLLTRALAWVLRPEGHHGMGSAALDAFAAHLGLSPVPADSHVHVVTEQSRGLVGPGGSPALTRADLVIYTRDWTLVIEAKVFAPEQPAQLDRLHGLWADETNPRFVYLTRGNRAPRTALTSAGHWRDLSWSEVAGVLRAAVDVRSLGPGVQDFIETLEAYHRA